MQQLVSVKNNDEKDAKNFEYHNTSQKSHEKTMKQDIPRT